MMNFLGVNWPYRILGKTLNYSREYFIDQIAIYLGGRIGEKMLTGKISTGASLDLNNANRLARNMIMHYGFSENATNQNRSYITSEGEIRDYLISDKKKDNFDKEIQSIINEATKLAEDIINDNKELLETISTKLLEEEILTGDELEQICKEFEESKN